MIIKNIERSDIFNMWNHRYDEVLLHSPKLIGVILLTQIRRVYRNNYTKDEAIQ